MVHVERGRSLNNTQTGEHTAKHTLKYSSIDRPISAKRYIYILHLGHLADAFIQSDLQRVHSLKERQQYITVVPEDIGIELFSSIPIYETN